MSKIKIGDRCRAYDSDLIARETGMVIGIIDDYLKIMLDEPRLYSEVFNHAVYDNIQTISGIHRKQCRRLVKKVWCDECEGLGSYFLSLEDCKRAANGKPVRKHICQKCNGSGKIKN